MSIARSLRSQARKRRGFTLLELVVAVVILTILSALAIPTFQSVINSSKDAAVKTEMNAIATNAAATAQLATPRIYTPALVNTTLSEMPPPSGAASWSLSGTAPDFYDSHSAPSTSPGTLSVGTDGSTLDIATVSTSGQCITGVYSPSGAGVAQVSPGVPCTADSAPGAGSPPTTTTTTTTTPSDPGSVPAAVAGLTATGGDESVTLAWDAVDGATGYRIYLVDTTTGASTLYLDQTMVGAVLTGLAPSTPYMFYVTAYDTGGEGPPPGSAVEATTTPWAGLLSQTLTWASDFTSPGPVGSYLIAAHASSGLTPVLTIDSSTPSGTCSATAQTANYFTITFDSGATGTCTVDADQPGAWTVEGTYLPATEIQTALSAADATGSTTTTTTAPAAVLSWRTPTWAYSSGTGAYTVRLTTTNPSTAGIVFSLDASSTSGACTLVGHPTFATVTFTGPGTCVLDANQGARGGYAAAAQIQTSMATGL